MTWFSEYSTVPGFFLASSTIQCHFVNRFAGSMSPPVLPDSGSLLRDASLPSFGSHRAWFPALAGIMKALRLPTCASAAAYLFASAAHVAPPVFVFASALRWGGGPLPARALGCRPPV